MNEHPWYRSRRYIHFDRSIGLKAAESIVTNPTKVASHAFYPLISFSVKSKKIKQDKATNQLIKKIKERPIAYAAHVDSHIYSYYAKIIGDAYEGVLSERGLCDCVLAFRSLGKNNIHFANDAFKEIQRRESCEAIGLDIKGFFDNLDHALVKRAWCDVLSVDRLPADHFNIFRSITKFCIVEKYVLFDRLGIKRNNPHNGRDRICSPEDFRNVVRGGGLIEKNKAGTKAIPQGSPISALLSNIYMLTFDQKVKAFVDKIDGKYMRYCDDMLLIVPAGQKIATLNFVAKCIEEVKLEIQTEKNIERAFKSTATGLEADKPLQYLGFLFDGRNVYLRSASLARYRERTRKGVALAKASQKKYNALRLARGLTAEKLYRKKLFRRYAYTGRRNFVSYGYRAAAIFEADSIRKQLKPMWKKLISDMAA